ncbi:hypothetical protein [Thermomonospora cellulosilytica]|uniref:Uncharacterized protein n=1 Tax=Thermomonospora cellulosilytica TaxID=1411118 RepID=A0A7W3RB27_9ACTN|nr:hypothetical protein [Thermomonospora cellulosilytica]MBA9005895.1 hypothetical protein [Thermomonospora cellulosilytica]
MAILRTDPGLMVGDPQELHNRRGPGLRVVVEVALARQPPPPTVIRVKAERADQPQRGRGRLGGRRALPPGG